MQQRLVWGWLWLWWWYWYIFDTVEYEEYIEYYTEELIDPMVEFQGVMDPAVTATIEVSAPTVEAEEHLMEKTVYKLY